MGNEEKKEIVAKMEQDARTIADLVISWGCLGDRVKDLAEGLISADRELALLEMFSTDEHWKNAHLMTATEYAGKYKILPEKLRGGPLETLFSAASKLQPAVEAVAQYMTATEAAAAFPEARHERRTTRSTDQTQPGIFVDQSFGSNHQDTL